MPRDAAPKNGQPTMRWVIGGQLVAMQICYSSATGTHIVSDDDDQGGNDNDDNGGGR